MKPARRPPARRRLPFRRDRSGDWAEQEPTWRAASPALISAATTRALTRPAGNWFVLGATRAVGADRPIGRTVAGQEVVAWRGSAGELLAGPGACPHLGAPLCRARVRSGRLICHWHGLPIEGRAMAGWAPYPTYDDGLLAWVRLDDVGGEAPLDRPVLPPRPTPARAIATVTEVTGVCEPQDVIANRLDPWHGGWLHPYAFAALTVVEAPARDGSDPLDRFVVDVSFRLPGRAMVVPTRAVFTAPGRRTVVMRVEEGEGVGSVVETHAVPVGLDDRGRPLTSVVEAVIAVSDRPGFAVGRLFAPALRPLVRRTAARLWRDDLAYAQRRWQLRHEGRSPG